MTFLAAKQFNRCVEGTDIPALTPLQVRYIAKANTGLADRSVFARMFNWRYYDRDDQSEQSMMWVVDTRFHDHFDELSGRLVVVDDPVTAYQDLGRAISIYWNEEPAGHIAGGGRILGRQPVLGRLLLARLFTRPANLLVLDEPAQAVDLNGQVELYDLIQDIRKRRGLT